MEIDIRSLMRPNIQKLTPYASARSEFTGKADVFLDANENSFASVGSDKDYTRYPDPLQKAIKQKLAQIEYLSSNQIFLGNGSDEGIDLLLRIFCNPGKDKVLIMPPTYGMYKVSADINDLEVIKVPLKADFSIDVPNVMKAVEEFSPKVLFICSPNNPTGNVQNREDILEILRHFKGIVAIDEAYIDFCPEHSFLGEITNFNNLVIFRTFSKAWGLAALRLGIAYSNQEIITAFNGVKPPYNINAYTQEVALQALGNLTQKDNLIEEMLSAKAQLIKALSQIPEIEEIFPSDTNFIFLKMKDAVKVYQQLLNQGIIIRNQTKVYPEGLRITVGTPTENEALLKALLVSDEL
jgi:histidinol-phosphate aminotransferase